MHLVVGDVSGADRELPVAVIEHDSGTFIVVHQARIYRAMVGIFDMDAVPAPFETVTFVIVRFPGVGPSR